MGVELGLWEGNYQNQAQVWLRWWDLEGNLLPTGTERAERAERAQLAAIPKLQSLGLSAEQISEALGLSLEEVLQYEG
jgi:predicted transposase YdaD